jgi:rubrerythrin
MARSEDTPQFRSMRSRLAAYESWARTEDRSARTWPGRRRAMLDRFEKEVDPEGKLTVQERAKRAEWARKAHMQRMALKSAAARQRRKRICQSCGESKEPEAPMCPKCLRKLCGK